MGAWGRDANRNSNKMGKGEAEGGEKYKRDSVNRECVNIGRGELTIEANYFHCLGTNFLKHT